MALGHGADSSGDRNIAIGKDAKVSGRPFVKDSVAIGARSQAEESDTVSVGNPDLLRRIVYVAKGKAVHDAVNKGQLDSVGKLAKRAAMLGRAANARAMTPGPQGVPGVQGVAGKDGKDGAQGAAGINGKGGKDGAQGAAGMNGKDGKDGAQGAAGMNGKDGKDGAQGAAGMNGKDGKDGAQGAAGKDGINGMDGAQGDKGDKGDAAIAKLTAEDGSTIAQAFAIAQGEMGEHVVIGAHGDLSMAVGEAHPDQIFMTLTNQLGNTHGIVIEEDRVLLSGGAHSTTLTLDDNGLSLRNTQTGAPVVISGVAAGVAPTDAANVGQVHAVVDAAVVPLNGRLDAVESSVQQLDQKINAVEKKLSGGVAMAMALSQPVSFAPKSTSAVTGGVATYNGRAAMGFSFNRLVANTETHRTVVSLGVAAITSGRSAACARVGASFSW